MVLFRKNTVEKMFQTPHSEATDKMKRWWKFIHGHILPEVSKKYKTSIEDGFIKDAEDVYKNLMPSDEALVLTILHMKLKDILDEIGDDEGSSEGSPGSRKRGRKKKRNSGDENTELGRQDLLFSWYNQKVIDARNSRYKRNEDGTWKMNNNEEPILLDQMDRKQDSLGWYRSVASMHKSSFEETENGDSAVTAVALGKRSGNPNVRGSRANREKRARLVFDSGCDDGTIAVPV